MRVPFQSFTKQQLAYRPDLLKAFETVLDSDWYVLGNQVKQFEIEFAEYLGAKYCIGVANGLEALQISLLALGVSAGDEVITTPLSAVATTLAIMAVGATPIFVDTDESGLITAAAIKEAIGEKTKAVIPVHLYGNSASVSSIKKLCAENNLYLIEDAAQAHGTTWEKKKVGTFGSLGCFSFYPTKNLGALGDGGAIVTDDSSLAHVCSEIRNYGQSAKYVHTRVGLNSRLDEVQAAILRVKLRHLDAENLERAKLANVYKKELSGVDPISIIEPDSESNSNYHLFVITAQQREGLQKFLKNVGVESLVHYPLAIPDQPMFVDTYRKLDVPTCRLFCKSVLSLPCSPGISEENVVFVCNSIKKFYQS